MLDSGLSSRNALLFFFSSRRRHTRCSRDWSSDVCSSDLVDALGRPFVERSSSLILNCHGCRYQSKHYVLKNMWVKLEIPHPETGQPPRSVRGRVAWIQRPRTVRQLFQVAVELEVSGNLWGIAFPPEDWFAFPEGVHAPPVVDGAPVPPALPPPTAVLEPEAPASLGEAEFPRADASDNVRVFPSPASATDASLQLARQVARLVADARQQIQAAAQEAASHAVSAERRLSLEQWEQKLDRKSTRLNSSHGYISYAVFCLKKKNCRYNESAPRYAIAFLDGSKCFTTPSLAYLIPSATNCTVRPFKTSAKCVLYSRALAHP